jgi:hypothetical protein
MKGRLVPPVAFPISLSLFFPGSVDRRRRDPAHADLTAARGREGYAMKMPKDIKPTIWGAVAGAAACAVIGFTWGGWVTGASARRDAGVAAHNATVAAMAPFCAERFRAQNDAPARMAELSKASTWERSQVLEKSGFAFLPDGKTSDSDIARACAELLMAPTTPKT